MNNHTKELLSITLQELLPLKDDFVLVGGSTVHLYVIDRPEIADRVTLDVDMVVDTKNRQAYESFAKRLRKLGFSEDPYSPVICRFIKNVDGLDDPIVVDVMPTNPQTLGFTNRWYSDGYKTAETINVNGEEFKIFTPPYMLASKIEAFLSRGGGDFAQSHDISDIVTVLEGRSNLASEVLTSPKQVREFIKSKFTEWLNDRRFLSSIEAHISDRGNLQEVSAIIIDRMKRISEK